MVGLLRLLFAAGPTSRRLAMWASSVQKKMRYEDGFSEATKDKKATGDVQWHVCREVRRRTVQRKLDPLDKCVASCVGMDEEEFRGYEVGKLTSAWMRRRFADMRWAS